MVFAYCDSWKNIIELKPYAKSLNSRIEGFFPFYVAPLMEYLRVLFVIGGQDLTGNLKLYLAV